MRKILSMVIAVFLLFGSMLPVSAAITVAAPTAEWAKENSWTSDGSGYTKEIDNIHYSLFYGWIKSEDYNLDEPAWQISTMSSPDAKGIVEIPSSIDGFPVTSIGKLTFSYNNHMIECNFPEGIELIGEGAFYNCRNLEKVLLPDTLRMIDSMAFYSCPILTELTIPASVEKIARNAFLRNTTLQEGLEKLTFLGSAPKVSYATEETGYSLTDLDGVELYINSESGGWDSEIWTKYNLHYIEDILPYADVVQSDWFYEAASFNYSEKIMTGLDKNRFGPYESLSRAQVVVLLYRMSKSPDVAYENVLKDVGEGIWYTDAVIWAYKNGIVTGYKDGCFGIEKPVTREELITILYRYAQYIGCDTKKKEYTCFEDASAVSNFAEEAMSWGVADEIITGKEKGTLLDPQGITARAEGAVVIQRFLKSMEWK